MPTVALNLLFLAPGRTGGAEVYARELVPRLPAAFPEARFVVIAGRELAAEWRRAPWHPDIALRALPVSSDTRVRRVAAEQLLVAGAVRRAGADLVHSLATTMPLLTPGTRAVTTILDVIYKEFPETHAGVLAKGMATLVPLSARRAERILTLSEAAGEAIVHHLGVPREKVRAVPLGPGAEPQAVPTPAKELRARLDLGTAPIVLSPSAKRPHKNLGRLVEALALARATPAPVLVVPGYHTPFEAELEERARAAGVADRLRFTGWIDDAGLEGLYAAAACVAFPSLSEGFGLPVLEAMRRGVPVACSDIPVLREVAGDAAELFDPHDPAAIAAGLDRVLGDRARRVELVVRGTEQAARFSWEATARGTADVHREVLAS
jgi:glycosyltransferase involved in cell wall biosynthesis